MAIGLGISPMLRRYRSGYGAYTTAWYNQVLANGGTTTPTELAALTVFETAVGGDIAEFDRLGIMGMQSEIAARTSFVNPTSTMLTLVNSPTFTAGLGFTGNGTTMYINANYNPTSNAVKFQLNNNSFGAYCRLNLSETRPVIGGGNGAADYSTLYPVHSVGRLYTDNNSGSSATFTNADSRGLTVSKRVASGAVIGLRNGSVLTPVVDTRVSVGLPNVGIFLLGYNVAGTPSLHSNNQMSAYYFASGAINQSTFYTALQNLGTTLGWAV